MKHTEKIKEKIWITPEIKTITGFNVHESVVATSGSPVDPFNNSSAPHGTDGTGN